MFPLAFGKETFCSYASLVSTASILNQLLKLACGVHRRPHPAPDLRPGQSEQSASHLCCVLPHPLSPF